MNIYPRFMKNFNYEQLSSLSKQGQAEQFDKLAANLGGDLRGLGE